MTWLFTFKTPAFWNKGISLLFCSEAKKPIQANNFELYQPDGYIHVYTDGSHSVKNARLGMGWVIKLAHDDELLGWEFCDIINRLKNNRQNIAAEALAVINCLQMLPMGSRIKVHTDLEDNIRLINSHVTWDKYYSGPLSGVWEQLKEELKRHSEVTAIYASDKDNYSDLSNKCAMRLAHNMAALASGADSQKTLLSKSHVTKYDHIFKPNKKTKDLSKYGSTDGALDIR